MLNLIKAAAVAGAVCTTGAACAYPAPVYPAAAAGGWTLVAARCPDLVEDRRDRRITWSRADLREDRRDARRVRCPASAYVWTGPGRPAVRAAAVADAYILYTPGGLYAVRDRYGRDVDVRIVVDAR